MRGIISQPAFAEDARWNAEREAVARGTRLPAESALAIGTGPNRRIFTKKLGSQQTPCWRKADSNPWSPLNGRRVRDHPCHLARIRIPA